MAYKLHGTILMEDIWEYKITEAQQINRAAGFADHLDQMGKEGCELVTVDTFEDLGVHFYAEKACS